MTENSFDYINFPGIAQKTVYTDIKLVNGKTDHKLTLLRPACTLTDSLKTCYDYDRVLEVFVVDEATKIF